MQELRFLGAAGTVTGSKFLLATPGGKVLVDCGMYQGDRELRQRNWAAFPVPSHEIDAALPLTGRPAPSPGPVKYWGGRPRSPTGPPVPHHAESDGAP